MTINIPLPRGKFTILDDVDLDVVSTYRWGLHQANQRDERFYATTTRVDETGKWRTLYLHRLLLMPAQGLTVDHINGDGLDNPRSNLRIATRSQNNTNRISVNALGYRGIFRNNKRFAAEVSIPNTSGRRHRYLGTYDTAEEAARVYDRAALEQWGKFARLNFPDDYEAADDLGRLA